MIYTDGHRLTADTLDELFAFAVRHLLSKRFFREDVGFFPIFGNARKLIMRSRERKLIQPEEFDLKAEALKSTAAQ